MTSARDLLDPIEAVADDLRAVTDLIIKIELEKDRGFPYLLKRLDDHLKELDAAYDVAFQGLVNGKYPETEAAAA